MSNENLGGKRYDDGKTRYDLIPFDALHALAEVYTQGAAKYEPRNWEKGMLWSRCLGSLMRHIAAWQNGEDIDAESGSPHMAHAAWNAFALLTYHLRGMAGDDRPAGSNSISRRAHIEKLLGEEFKESNVSSMISKQNAIAAYSDLESETQRQPLGIEKIIALIPGAKVKLYGAQEETWTILSVLGNGKFEIQSAFNQGRQMIHMRAISDVIEEAV